MPINDLHSVASFCVVFVSLLRCLFVHCVLLVVRRVLCVDSSTATADHASSLCGIRHQSHHQPPQSSIIHRLNHIINHRCHPSSVVGNKNPEPIPLAVFQSHSSMARTKKRGEKHLALLCPRTSICDTATRSRDQLKNKHSRPAAAAHPPGRRHKRRIFR